MLCCAVSGATVGYALPCSVLAEADTLRRLDEVAVVVQQTDVSTAPEIIPVQQLSGNQLRRLSAHNVADALRYFSGVQIKDYGGVGGLKTVNIRSLGSQHVGVFYDGIELGNAQNGQVDLGRFSLENMESVSLYNGQKSTVFQSAKDFASAASIYLLPRTPDFQSGKNANFRATFKTGSFGMVNPLFLWEQKCNDRLAFSLQGDWLYTTGRYKFRYQTGGGYDTTAVRQNGDVQALHMECGLFGKMQDGKWRIKSYTYASERGFPGAVVRNKFMHEDRQWDLNTFLQGSFEKCVSNLYTLSAKGKYSYDYLRYLADPNKDETLFYADNRYHQQEGYVSLIHGFHLLPYWNFGISTDYQCNILRANLRDFSFPQRHMALLSLSTSWDWKQVKLQGSLLGTYVHDRVKDENKPRTDRMEWTPTVVCSYQPFALHEFYIRSFFKRIFRMPTLNDLYYTLVGNSLLRPEYTNQYNVGFVYTKFLESGFLRKIEMHTDGYYNQIEDKIVSVPTSNAFRWTMLNLGLVRVLGVDAAVLLSGKLGQEVYFDGRLNYTYQKARDLTDPSSEFYGGQIPYIPWHSGSAIVGLRFRSWEMNYSFIYTGKRYSSSANISENYQLPWYTSDITMSYFHAMKRGDLRFTVEVNNVFNQQYEVVVSYPMPGTNFKIIAQYDF